MTKVFQSIYLTLLILLGIIGQARADLPMEINLQKFSCQNYVTLYSAQTNHPSIQNFTIKLQMWADGYLANDAKILPPYFLGELSSKILKSCKENLISVFFDVYQAEHKKLLQISDQNHWEQESYKITEVTCKELLTNSQNLDEEAPLFIFWVDGYLAKEPLIKYNKIEHLIQQVEEQCRKTPTRPLFFLTEEIRALDQKN